MTTVLEKAPLKADLPTEEDAEGDAGRARHEPDPAVHRGEAPRRQNKGQADQTA